ncbi:MAG: ABC transporter ATP-binding protein [Bacteroidales bacterium]|nr:ABC transporter ATP-binding protein [Bacteroidales bacterium]
MTKVIDIENLCKTYHVGSQSVHALKNITLTIKKGEFVSIMGHSGSGKSTLLNILGCLDTPTSGKYILNDNNVMGIDEDMITHIRNKEIGFVFQSFNLLPRYSAIDNVGLPLIYANVKKPERVKMSRSAIEQVGLAERADHKPNELSGGQCQRVAIARALVNSPAIILADEPTGNLDSTTTRDIMELFVKLHQKGNTIIIVTHEDDIAEFTQRKIVLFDGMIESDEKVLSS